MDDTPGSDAEADDDGYYSADPAVRELSIKYRCTFGMTRILDIAFSRVREHGISGVEPFTLLLALFEKVREEELLPADHASLSQAVAGALLISDKEIAALWQAHAEEVAARQEIPAARGGFNGVLIRAAGIANALAEDQQLAIRHLLLALLECFERHQSRDRWSRAVEELFDYERMVRALQDHVARQFDVSKPDAWRRMIAGIVWRPTPSSERRGAESKFDRNASDVETSLKVDVYADCLAQLLTKAGPGEFAFAIYGHWGRGKTFLVDHVERALERRQANYAVVRYSAWQFPSTPEAWVHLYESFAQVAFDRPWWQRFPTIFRTALEKRGSGGFALLFVLLSLGVVALRAWTTIGVEVLGLVLPTLGIGGLIWLLTWFWKVRSTGSRLAADYLSASRHTEKLGLQATIGADLKRLLLGWIPDFRHTLIEGTLGLLAPLAVFFVVSAWQIQSFAAGSHWSLAMVGVGALVIGTTCWLRWGGSRLARVLLVVDDLDRCKREHLLAVVESIKLQLQDPQIARRVQTLVLVEEDALKSAIAEKYPAVGDETSAAAIAAAHVAREVGEKLFTAHLRLPPLSLEEAIELLELFTGRRSIDSNENRSTDMSPLISGRLTETGEAQPVSTSTLTMAVERHRDATPGESRAPSPDAATTPTSEPEEPVVPSKSVFEPAEINKLIDALKRHGADERLRETLGPRTIRALLFRYQLARLLLDRLNHRYKTSDLADGLIRECLACGSAEAKPLAASTKKNNALQWVIGQVC